MGKKNKKILSSDSTEQNDPIKKHKPSAHHKKQFLGKFQEAHDFLQDNEHILNGYRINYNTPKSIVKSLFLVHNQTVNIWTHLIGAIIIFFIIFQGIAYQMQQSHVLGRAIIKDVIPPHQFSQQHMFGMDPKALCEMLNEGLQQGEMQFECSGINMTASENSQQRESDFSNDIATWPIIICLMGCAACLACSTTFHLIYPMNAKTYKLSLSLDFAGIGMNMAFSPIPAFYYSLYCHPSTAAIYIVLIFIAGIISFVTSLIDWFHKKENLFIRNSILAVSAIICLAGLIHLMVNQFIYSNYGDGYTIVPSLYFFIPTLLSYALGFYTYLQRCPERFKPGKFDICGHSHQIWHLLVFTAIVLTYLGSLACFEVRSKWPVCPADFGIVL